MEESNLKINEIVDNEKCDEIGFKLISLRLEDNPILGNLSLNFCDDLNNLEDYPFNTILIGPNGTGKSNILRTIINLFREIHEIKEKGKRINRVPGKFLISYLLNGKLFVFGNLKLEGEYMSARFSKGFWFLVDGVIEDDYQKINLPDNIIANSLMITDKYPYLKVSDFPNYTYLGVRSSRSSAGTRAYVRKTVELITASLEKKGFKSKLKNILEFLELQPSINIYYKPVYATEFYKENIDENEFHRIFNNQNDYFPKRRTEIWGTKYYHLIKDNHELISQIVSFLRYVATTFLQDDKKLLHYDVLEDENLLDDFKMIEELKRLDIISFPSIDIKRKDSTYNLVESSSGEYSLLSSLIGLVATVEDNSLILIDEPEVSLHPNWQMRYMEYLREMFKGFNKTHFIVATHSHFLVSDVKGVSSQVIGLKKKEGIKPVHFKNVDTFGWSAEDVLYNIFDVESTRNFYVAKEIGTILKSIAKKDIDTETIIASAQKIAEIKRSLKKTDPLYSLINKIQTKFIDG